MSGLELDPSTSSVVTTGAKRGVVLPFGGGRKLVRVEFPGLLRAASRNLCQVAVPCCVQSQSLKPHGYLTLNFSLYRRIPNKRMGMNLKSAPVGFMRDWLLPILKRKDASSKDPEAVLLSCDVEDA